MSQKVDHSRRRLLSAGLSAVGLLGLSAARAAQWLPTPSQSQGPFYPLHLPLDNDNDLVRIAGQSGVAQGEIVDVIGTVRDAQGRPVRNARVEIWQCDANGRYHHPGDRRDVPLDPYFQGYGQFFTGVDGAYRFRTIKPVAYPGRAPHIHFTVSGANFAPLTTQLYRTDAPENAWDGLLNSIDPKARQRLLVEFARVPTAVAPVGYFEIILAAR